MGIFDRVRKAFTTPATPARPVKSGFAPFAEDVALDRRRDISNSDWGWAQAYSVIEAVRSCCDIYADKIESMPFRIVYNPGYDPANDEIIAQSSDVRPRLPVQAAFRRYRKQYNISLFRRMTYSSMLYDRTYIELIRDETWSPSDVRWLNPLGVNHIETGGRIVGFSYSWNGDTFATLTPQQVAYDHGFSPYDDNAGLSIVMSVLNEINIDFNLKAFLRDIFSNNARPGLLAYIEDPTYANNPELISKLESAFAMYHKGKGNQGRTMVSPVKLGVQAFELPDMQKNMELSAAIRKQIYAAFGVPLAMAGDTDSTRYKESADVNAIFVQTRVKPLLLRFQDFFNDSIMPFFDPSGNTRLEFDTSQYDLLTEVDQQRANMVLSDMSAGLITIGQAQELRQYEVDDRLADYYVIEGIPVPPDKVAELWRYKFAAQPALDAPELQPQLTVPVMPEMRAIDNSPDAHKSTCECEHCHPEAPLPYRALFVSADLYEDNETCHARQHEELKAWYTFEKARKRKGNKTRDFVCNVVEPFVKYAVIDRMEAGLPLDVAILEVWQDDSVKTKVSYRQRARNIARQIYERRITKGEAYNQFQELVAREYEAAFRRGLRLANMAWDELTADERAELMGLINDETQYVYGLIDAIWLHPEGESLDPIRNRIELWVSRIDRIEQYGLLVASGDQKMMWKFNPRKEHCSDCLYLNGRVYRASVWLSMDIQPQSPKLECFGTFCGCELSPTDAPVTRGRPAKW